MIEDWVEILPHLNDIWKKGNPMALDQRSLEIANAFLGFIATGEKSLIENFTREEIESALSELHSDKAHQLPYYDAMKKRAAELRDLERHEREAEEKWRNRIIGFISGLIIALIIILLRRYILSS
jgi:hypothetical protein